MLGGRQELTGVACSSVYVALADAERLRFDASEEALKGRRRRSEGANEEKEQKALSPEIITKRKEAQHGCSVERASWLHAQEETGMGRKRASRRAGALTGGARAAFVYCTAVVPRRLRRRPVGARFFGRHKHPD